MSFSGTYLLHYPPLLSIRPYPAAPYTSSVFTDVSTTARDPSRFIPSCSHHWFDTHAPGRHSASSHSSRIIHVAIYCAIVFCLWVIYVSTSSNTASLISSPPRWGGGGNPSRHRATSEAVYLSDVGPPCGEIPLASFQCGVLPPKSLTQRVVLPGWPS